MNTKRQYAKFSFVICCLCSCVSFVSAFLQHSETSRVASILYAEEGRGPSGTYSAKFLGDNGLVLSTDEEGKVTVHSTEENDEEAKISKSSQISFG